MAVVKNMMVRVGADFSGLITGSQRALGSTQKWASGTQSAFAAVRTAGAGLNGVLGALGVGISLAGIGAAVGKCLELGSALNEVQNVVDTTFPTLSREIDAFSRSAAASFGLSETMAKKFTGTFGAMAKALGFSELAAASMAETLTGLSGDVASFYNLDQETAFNKLKAVFTGETEGLKELGIVMTQSALDQFALANGFGKTTAKMSEQEKALLRYQFVLSKLSEVSGDFSRTSDSWANQVRLLRLQFEQLGGVLGQTFITAFTPVIQALNQFMTGLVKAANTFKAFIYALYGQDMGGNSTQLNQVQSAVAGVGGAFSAMGEQAEAGAAAAAKAMRQLYSFDRINRLSVSSGGGGGDGGGGGSTPNPGELGDTSPAIDNTVWDLQGTVEPLERLSQQLQDLASSLRLVFQDVFVDWDEKLNPENITEKVIFGLGTLLGGAAGFSIGGIPGAIVGTLSGAALSLLFNAVTFDHDGQLGREEIGRSLTLALFGLAGGAAGFIAGGPSGALIGVSVGAGLYMGLSALDWKTNGALSGVLDGLTKAAGMLAGGAIGFLVGGPAGAAVGITLGAGLSFALDGVAFGVSEGWSVTDWIKELVKALANAALNGLAFAAGGPGGTAIGMTLSLGLSLLLEKTELGGGSETPTVDVGVNLVKNAWDTVTGFVSRFMGGALNKPTGLTQSGWDTVTGFVSRFMGGALNKPTGLIQSGWKTVTEWAGRFMGGALNKPTGLIQSGWDTVTGFVSRFMGGGVKKPVGVKRSDDWTNLAGFVSRFMGGRVRKPIGVQRDGWSNISGWISNYMGGILKKAISLGRDGWGTISGWIQSDTNWGDTVTKKIRVEAANQLTTKDIIKPGTVKLRGNDGSEHQWRLVPQARGGVVNAAAILGNYLVGEDGREAIVPLENHREWTRPVAEDIAELLRHTERSSTVHAHLYLDGREVYQTVIRNGQADAARGVYPLAGLA